MLVIYMRVSADGDHQVMGLQQDALLAAGVDERHLFEDRASGARRKTLTDWDLCRL
jgi:DNA invertase Pin-like site-specific DNA recombinase